MGLLDHYRQFDDIDREAENVEKRERRRREKLLALEQVPDLDLSGTEWPDMPNAEVVNAAIARARGRINGYPDRHAALVRRLLAERHGIDPELIALGNGAAELLQAASLALLSEGDELVMPWPSYPLYPLLAARARARPVSVEHGSLLDAVTDRTRALVICNPNDPTGAYVPSEELGALLSALPPDVVVLLDEALIHFQDVEPVDSCLKLVEAFPQLLVIRTFSKVYGLSGLRAGYAVSSNSRLLSTVAPVLGVNTLTQAAVQYAISHGDGEVENRRRAVIRERTRLLDGLRGLPVEADPSEANVIWLRARDYDGARLTERLRAHGVIVATGGPLGADDHVRVTVRTAGATDRFLSALDKALTPDEQ